MSCVVPSPKWKHRALCLTSAQPLTVGGGYVGLSIVYCLCLGIRAGAEQGTHLLFLYPSLSPGCVSVAKLWGELPGWL